MATRATARAARTVRCRLRPPIKFGEVSMDELKMTIYDKDSSAEAVILFDVGEYTDGDFTRHTRIKILKEDGYSWANVLIPVIRTVRSTAAALKNVRASTYNLVDGKIEETKLESDGKFKEEFVKGLNVMRFTMPKVKVGSIIEYKYELGGLGDWEFQHLIPCKWSEYRISVWDGVVFHVHFKGYLAPIVNEEKFEPCHGEQCQVRRWVMVDVPAFKMEPFIAHYRNYTSQVTFDIASIQPPGRAAILFMTNWDALRNRYNSTAFFDDNLRASGFLKKTARDLVEGMVNPDEKVKAIYNFVKTKLEWTGRNTMFTTDEPKRILEASKGSSGDINLILLSMLRYAGLPADPVLISTVENGFVRQEVPNSSQFNSVLVWSDYKARKILLDATDKHLSMDYLPQSCLNGSGYVAAENNFRWVELTGVPKTRHIISLDLQAEGNGDLNGSMSFSKTGYEARNTREKISKHGKNEYFKETFKGKALVIKDSVIENIDKINEALKERYSMTLSDYAQVSGDVMYIEPMIFAKTISNPFISETRTYPVDFEFPRETLFSLKLRIPEGFVVDELPQSKLAVLPDNAGKFVYSVSQTEGAVTITNQLSINKALFSQDEYPVLREFYNIVAAKHNEQIVLKRK